MRRLCGKAAQSLRPKAQGYPQITQITQILIKLKREDLMESQMDIKKIDTKIQLLKKTTEELNQLCQDFPAVARNSLRILASVKMLEINVSDLVELDS